MHVVLGADVTGAYGSAEVEREYGDEGRDAVGVILEKVHEDMERQRVEGVREEA